MPAKCHGRSLTPKKLQCRLIARVKEAIRASSSAGYTITLQNRLLSSSITAAGGSAVELKYQYTSVDPDGVDDGDGIGTLIVNGASVATVSVPQGESTLDVAQYLTSGANTVKLKVENSEGSSRTLSYTITVVTLTMTTTIDTMAVYSAATTFNYSQTRGGTLRRGLSPFARPHPRSPDRLRPAARSPLHPRSFSIFLHTFLRLHDRACAAPTRLRSRVSARPSRR